MRIYEGDYAYEIEPEIDLVTRVGKGWRYNVYRVRPQDQLLRSGSAQSREEAEKAGEKVLAELRKSEGQGGEAPRRPAA